MNLEEAKQQLIAVYNLIGEMADESNLGKGLPSRILLDGRKIVMVAPQQVVGDPSPRLQEFLKEYEDLWISLKKQRWNESEARDLVQFEKHLWDKHFG